MKIAAIVVTYNDGFKIKEWHEHHQLYCDEVHSHIIVDNGSVPEYLLEVENLFPNSTIIKRMSNGGSTAAYNDGIKYALKDPEIDSILFVGNDVKLESGGITDLYNLLMSNERYGMVAPILLEKDSFQIADFGCEITKTLSLRPYKIGESVADVKQELNEAETLTGGMNLSKRSFYEVVGLQDEKLFMYSDEVDIGLRASFNNYSLVSTSHVKSWHQHINDPSRGDYRHPFSFYLIGRNKVYLAKKHFNILRVIFVFLYYAVKAILGYLKSLKRRDKVGTRRNVWLLLGTLNGLVGNMNQNVYSRPD